MSIGSFIGTTIRGINSLDNRARKRVVKNATDLVAEATDNDILRQTSKNIKNTPLSQFEDDAGAYSSLAKAGTKGMTDSLLNKKSGTESNDVKEPEAPTQTSGNPNSSGSPKTSTVSNNKTNTMQNNNTNNAPIRQQPQQLQPDDYEQWRQRRMANGTSYNEVFESAVDKFIADPNSFSQEQRNALIEMGNKLGYNLGGGNTSAPVVQQRPANDNYYSNQGDYNFRFSL